MFCLLPIIDFTLVSLAQDLQENRRNKGPIISVSDAMFSMYGVYNVKCNSIQWN